MNRLLECAKALGFDLPRGRLALRTAVASGLALIVAWRLGLAHPQWAGMTVWIAVQPTRGQLLEKSAYRVIGTIVGAVVGALLLGGLGYQTMGLVIGLALWLGLSAALGNVHRGFAGYGFILAGYSAALVALLGGASTQPVVELGVDRALTALLGVGVAVLVTWWFTPDADVAAVEARARATTARVVRSLCQGPGGAEVGLPRLDRWLAELAAIDSALDALGIGARRARPLRTLLAAETQVLLWLHGAGLRAGGEVDRLSGAPSNPDPAWATLGEQCHALQSACEDATGRRVVGDLALALRALAARERDCVSAPPERSAPVLVLHRDWLGGAQAGARCLLLMLFIGSVWVATGWSAGAYALMGAAVLSTLFSSHEDPSRTMRWSLTGHVLAIAAALSCRWLVWPHIDGAAGQVMAIWPFLLLGAALIAHRRTSGAGLEYNLVTLLLLQPAFPARLSLPASLMGALGVLVGPIATAQAYRWIYPTNARHRLNTLTTMMALDLERMARARGAGDPVWRARLAHRTLRVAHWVGQVGAERFTPMEAGVTVLAMGEAISRARTLLERLNELTPHQVERLGLFLGRARSIDADCDDTVNALRQLSLQFGATHESDARCFAHAAESLGRDRAFFQRPA